MVLHLFNPFYEEIFKYKMNTINYFQQTSSKEVIF